jgi:hypothetical protein
VPPHRALLVVLQWLNQQVDTSNGRPNPCTA